MGPRPAKAESRQSGVSPVGTGARQTDLNREGFEGNKVTRAYGHPERGGTSLEKGGEERQFGV